MTFFLKYLPAFLQAIMAVQAALPTLKGESKLKLATDIAMLAAGIAGGVPNEHAQQVSAGISGTVAALKAAGVLVQDQPPVHPAA